jgi:uncharacterized membrane protein YeiH
VDLSSSEIIGILDRIGIVAFALSGVEVGARRRLDVFGLLVMGVITATGGGVMRDVLLGRLPLVLDKPDYMLVAVASSCFAIVLLWRNRSVPKPLLAVADAAGLGAFAAAGALAALHTDLTVVAAILMAMLTATGGGVLRDLLADRVPLVLRSEINATAAGVGGLCVWLFEPVSLGGAALLGVGVTAAMRVMGLAFDLHLPHPGTKQGKQKRLL